MLRHFTATAFVRDSQGRVLLLWHKHLQRWMPPGGHVDPNELPEDTARRECKEETGLDVEIMGDAQPDLFVHNRNEGRMMKKPFAMLLEEIPPFPGTDKKPAQEAHQHMDFLFLAKLIDEAQALTIAEHEADHLKWFTREEIDALGDEELFANVRAAILALNHQ